MSCTCTVGPGKFEGEPASTFLLHLIAQDGADAATYDDADDVTEWLRGPVTSVRAEEWQDANDYGYCRECIKAAINILGSMAGAAVWTDGQGFAGARIFESKEEFEALLAAEEAE